MAASPARLVFEERNGKGGLLTTAHAQKAQLDTQHKASQSLLCLVLFCWNCKLPNFGVGDAWLRQEEKEWSPSKKMNELLDKELRKSSGLNN